MDSIFKDSELSVEIYSEKEYERLTGEKLDDSIAETETISSNSEIVLDESEDTSDKKEDIHQEEIGLDSVDKIVSEIKEDKGIPLLRPVHIKTSNNFLNKLQEKEIERINKEAARIASADMDFPYVKSKLVTDAELQLYNFLQNNIDLIDRVTILTKVRLADIIEVDKRLTLSKTPFYKIAQKHVDFLICDKNTLDIICAVELDDFTHETEERKERDQFIMQALYVCGIITKRIRCRISTICRDDINGIQEMIYNYFAPRCSECGKEMKMKVNSRNGNRFYACIDNINCRKTLRIDGGVQLP